LTEFALPPSSEPDRIAPGSDGNLWFTEVKTKNIGRITPTGDINEFPLPTVGCQVMDITAGPDGNLWFTECYCVSVGGQIGRITPAGVITEFPLSEPDICPRGIVAGPNGRLWFAENHGSNGGIGCITP
jgi:virginiamycin B lyase